MSNIEEMTDISQSTSLEEKGEGVNASIISKIKQRIGSSDVGSLPILLGWLILVAIFQLQNENFLTARNFVSLIQQMAGILVIAIGVVFVLLTGEIDLSISYVSAVSGVLLALLLRDPTAIPAIGTIFVGLGITDPLPWYTALLLALGTVSLIGLIQGLIITKFQLPSFVVTLAGFMVWSGVVLILIGGAGTVIVQDKVIIGVANYFLPDFAILPGGQLTLNPDLIEGAVFSINVSWILALVVIVFFAVYLLNRVRVRRKQGVPTTNLNIVILEIVIVSLFTAAIAFVANQDRGLPLIAIILVLLLFGFSFLATRTRFGRYVYAVGGNKEAARRAGINVEWVRIRVFMISSLMAGVGGVVLASRLRSVATDAGGGDLLLNSIAAAVIGGTSLFGGSGRVSNAFLGALVIATVANGMGLLGLSSGVKFVVTGLVLLAAVLVDAITRRSRTQSGIL
ncbi:MAG: hypothetical protein WAM60_08765 [Candidatus Promineifilaceae bacterium]